MIQDSGETVCLVTFHDTPDSDVVADDYATAIQVAIDGLPVDEPIVHGLSSGSQIVLAEPVNDDDAAERVSITTKEVQEDL